MQPEAQAAGRRRPWNPGYYQPSSGLLFAEGWAADVSVPEPLRSLEPAGRGQEPRRWSRLEYGRPRPDLAPDCGREPAAGCGFEFTAFMGREAFEAVRQREHLDLVAVTQSGARVPAEMPVANADLRPLLDLVKDLFDPHPICRNSTWGSEPGAPGHPFTDSPNRISSGRPEPLHLMDRSREAGRGRPHDPDASGPGSRPAEAARGHPGRPARIWTWRWPRGPTWSRSCTRFTLC